MMFCYILSFEVVSAPVSSSLNYCPFLWIELLNKIKTSIFFSDFITTSFIGSRSLGCHATRFCKHVKRHDVLSYIFEEARKKKLPFTLGDDALFHL